MAKPYPGPEAGELAHRPSDSAGWVLDCASSLVAGCTLFFGGAVTSGLSRPLYGVTLVVPAAKTMRDATELFEEYHPHVYRYFRRMTERADVAEDLTQEVFLRVVRYLGRYVPRARERAWVFTIARAVLADHFRLAGRQPIGAALDDPDEAAPTPSPVVALGVAQALSRLPRRDRELLVLRELGGYSCEELGEIFGLTSGAARTRVYRVREAVRAMLGGRAVSHWRARRE
jgi:RNA polymerase sigma-70 factor, ECF subfamily